MRTGVSALQSYPSSVFRTSEPAANGASEPRKPCLSPLSRGHVAARIMRNRSSPYFSSLDGPMPGTAARASGVVGFRTARASTVRFVRM